MMLDVTKGDEQREQLEHELEEIGIRLNRTPPDIVFKSKTAGGITINATVPLTRIDERTIRGILQSYKVRFYSLCLVSARTFLISSPPLRRCTTPMS